MGTGLLNIQLWQWLTLPQAIDVYLIAVMVLVALLTAYILLALHLLGGKGNHGTKRAQQDGNTRFPNLTGIDQQQATARTAPYDHRTLAQICADFRNYAAGELGLYYDIADIRRFVAGMGAGRLVILRGMSGTGKTSLAYAAGEYFGNSAVIVPVQPMWKERSDILGYFNEFTGRFRETPLLCKLYEAGGSEAVYITVLDEVNIARIEYYFAEFLSLLEIPNPKKRELQVVSDSWKSDPKRLKDGKLVLPENMWFIGTANNDDSTFAISDKVYDRAMVMDMDRRCAPFVAKPADSSRISYGDLARQFAAAKGQYALSQDGRMRLAALEGYLNRVFRLGFGNRILRQIEDYVPVMIACGGEENGALDDIIARKILRKLEQLSPALLRQEIPQLQAFLEETFGQDALPQCRGYLNRLQKNC